MHPYLFYIGSFPIRAYGIIVVSAFLLGLGVAVYIAKAERHEELVEPLLDLSLLLFIAGVIGARIWQVFFFDWAYYRANPGEILAIWHGGLSIQGGVVGAVLVGWWYTSRHKLPFWLLADTAAPALILAQSIGRDANLMNGDAFGSPNPAGYGLLYPPDSIAQSVYPGQHLWPAEIWEGQMDVIIFALLLIVKFVWGKKMPQGWVFLLYVIAYNGARFLLEILRGDSPRFLFHWDAAQWTSVVVVALALGMMVWQAMVSRKARPAADGPDSTGGSDSPAAE
ncbi:MAG: prolipoprotein diacylglyceryl transferase [Symbiobacteriia bacterium]